MLSFPFHLHLLTILRRSEISSETSNSPLQTLKHCVTVELLHNVNKKKKRLILADAERSLYLCRRVNVNDALETGRVR